MQMTIRLKLMAGFLAVVAMLAVVAVIGIRGMQGIDQDLDELFEEDFKLVEAVDEVFIEALEAEVLLLEVAEAEDAAIQARHIEELNEQVILVEEHLADIGTQVRTDQERAFLARMEEDFLQFEAEIEEVEHLVEIGDHAGVSHVIETEVNVTFVDLKIVIGEFIHDLEVDAEAKKQHADESAASSTQLLIIISLAAAALAVLIGWLLSRQISSAVGKVADASAIIAERDLPQLLERMQAVANGDLTRADIEFFGQEVVVNSSDEIGGMANNFNTMSKRLHETGQATTQMVLNLRAIVGQVADSSAAVGNASGQLSKLSDQAGAATEQISGTMQDVAKGTNTASESLQKAAKGVSQLADATRGVAEGAQTQADQVQGTQQTMEKMAAAIGSVAENSQNVVSVAAETKAAAGSGADAVGRTVERMKSISDTVSDAAVKVKDLGIRSEEIGDIVGVINDIADQTNLLALNAAIEAARAGEMGRGFAVVAEEVRKLAERTGSATQEIVALVRAVQDGTNEAVASMESGAKEVQAGTEVAAEAGESIDAIQSAVDLTANQINDIAKAAEALALNSTEVEKAMTDVMAVVEQNTAAAEEMTGQAGEVNQGLESVSAISEENSAAAEQVSAATEEMNAQIEEMASSSEELAGLATALDEAVGKFKLDADSTDDATSRLGDRSQQLVASNGEPADEEALALASAS